MGLTLSGLDQEVYKGTPDSIDLGGSGVIAIAAYGETARFKHFLHALQKTSEARILLISSTEDSAPRTRAGALEVVSIEQAETVLKALGAVPVGEAAASVFIDVSCISRAHLGRLMATLKDVATRRPIDLKIGYAMSRFVKPPPTWATTIKRIAPVHPEFAGWTKTPDLPVAVVVALGYERGKAVGAVEYLEPRDTWIYIPNSEEDKFLKEVKAQNKQLLQDLPDHQFTYHVLAPVATYHSLLSLVRGMRHSARPILLPFGPKLFFALALLVAMVMEETSVWYVDGEDTTATERVQPSGDAVVMSCRLAGRVSDGRS